MRGTDRRLMMTFPGVTPPGNTYGAWVADESFLTALLRYGTWDHYEFLTNAASRESANQYLRDLRPTGATAVEMAELRSRGETLGLSAWHGSFPAVTVPFYIREHHATRPFPITLIQHSVNYQEFLHRYLLVLLMEMRPCDSIVCTSSAARKSVEILLTTTAARVNQRYGTRLSSVVRMDVLPLGIDTESLRPAEQPLARRQLTLPDEPIVLLWLGRVSATDKADLVPLLTAFRDVQQYAQALGGPQQRPLVLVIAGADPHGHMSVLDDYATALGIREDVRFFTNVDRHNKAVFYNAADVFVAPVDNIQETFGITPIEAMACGIPQVVADWDGYRDTVRHGETGMLVPTLWIRADDDLLDDPLTWTNGADQAALAQSVVVDPTALRSALVELVLNDDLRRRMSVASRARAEEIFSWRALIPRYEDMWADLRAVADTLGPLPRLPPAHVEPFFFDAFAHYATQVVEDDQVVVATPVGAQALAEGRELALRPDDAHSRVMRRALQALDDRELSMAELVRTLAADGTVTVPQSALRRGIMGLVKYGYARLA